MNNVKNTWKPFCGCQTRDVSVTDMYFPFYNKLEQRLKPVIQTY